MPDKFDIKNCIFWSNRLILKLDFNKMNNLAVNLAIFEILNGHFGEMAKNIIIKPTLFL